MADRLWWSDRTVRFFSIVSFAAYGGAFCLYRWGGAGSAPLVIVAVAWIAISLWLWSGRLDEYDAQRQERLARRPPRRYRYPMLVTGFVLGAVLGATLSWNELACGIVIAALFGAATERRHHRLGVNRTLGS